MAVPLWAVSLPTLPHTFRRPLGRLAALALVAGSAMMALSGCDNEVNVNAPHVERAVIYCLIDPASPRQIARVGRGFRTVGRESAFEAAQNRDSLEYRPEDIQLQLISVSSSGTGPQRVEGQFVDTTLPKNEGGIFFGGTQRGFVTRQSLALNSGRNYGLELRHLPSGRQFRGTTSLVGPMNDESLLRPLLQVEANGDRRRFYEPLVRIAPPARARVFKPELIIPVIERLEDSTDRRVEVLFEVGSESNFDRDPGAQVSFDTRGSDIVGTIANRLDAADTRVVRRRIDPMTLRIYYGSAELADYIRASRAQSVITQSRPIFTNVEGGLGIIASRSIRDYQVLIDRITLDQLRSQRPDLRF